MDKTISMLSTNEFTTLVEQTIDRRMSVWLTQLLDAFGTIEEDDDNEFQPEFAEMLKTSIAQAKSKDNIDLQSFRAQLTNG